MSLESFTRAYIEAALFTSTDESTPSGGYPLDKNYSIKDIDEDTLVRIQRDCAQFYEGANEIMALSELSDEDCGKDFWLSRNRSGSGFWDEYLDDSDKHSYAMTLQKIAQNFNEYNLFLGDDKKIYGS